MTIGEPGTAETRVQGSRFFGRALHVPHESAIETELERDRKKYYDASHWCWAARLLEGSRLIERTSDAGEPHGTAGLPMLRQMQGRLLHQCLVIVTRYFGGTKLGTGGLVRAYGECAAAALDNAQSVTRTRYAVMAVDCSYDDLNILYHQSKRFEAIVEAHDGSSAGRYRVSCRESKVDELIYSLTEQSGNRMLIVREGSWIR